MMLAKALQEEDLPMHRILSRMVVYRMSDQDSILYQLADVCRELLEGQFDQEELAGRVLSQFHRLLDLATQYGFDKNLWHQYLAWLIATTETPFSLTCEKTGARPGSVNTLAIRDFKLFKELFNFDFTQLEATLNLDCFTIMSHYSAIRKDRKTYNAEVSEKIQILSDAIAAAEDEQAVFQVVTAFYKNFGVGLFGLNKVFRLAGTGDPLVLLPISNTVDVRLHDLIGYERQKEQLVANTEAFIHGGKANNLLLYGDSGTGKSTCVKAILNEYHLHGLRIIELYKHQLQSLSAVISLIKNRNYRFIIFMDDLSFEDFETEFKHLKAVIEGGMEVTPDNVLIYATSNRRHLIRETWADRGASASANDIHYTDTVEEKISLVNRFGVTIRFDRPGRDDYLQIVQGIASRYPQIRLSGEDLTAAALQWAQWHGNLSGRRAQQFINHLLGQSDLPADRSPETSG